MSDRILTMELSPEDEKLLRESLSTWKEDVYASLLEEVEEVKSKKIDELEEANIQYREELKEEFTEKMLDALEEMKDQIRTEVIAEMVESNPELQILEDIKSLVAPTLDENYLGNIYSEQVARLVEENNELKEQIELEEGAKTLAELLAPYSEKTQRIVLSMIKEGGPEEVTEQFYELMESIKGIEEDEDENEEYKPIKYLQKIIKDKSFSRDTITNAKDILDDLKNKEKKSAINFCKKVVKEGEPSWNEDTVTMCDELLDIFKKSMNESTIFEDDDYEDDFDDYEDDFDFEEEGFDEDFDSYIEEGETGVEEEEETPRKTNPILDEIKGLSS